jgi:Predicted membrane protein
MQMKEQVWNESFRPGIISSTKLYFQDLFVGAKRMSRKDFWWGYLGMTIVAYVIMALLALAITKMPVDDFYWSSILGVALAITMGYYWIAVFTAMIRRLHDRKMRGWWILISLIPFVGEIALIVLLCLPQRDFGNRWPKEI